MELKSTTARLHVSFSSSSICRLISGNLGCSSHQLLKQDGGLDDAKLQLLVWTLMYMLFVMKKV